MMLRSQGRSAPISARPLGRHRDQLLADVAPAARARGLGELETPDGEVVDGAAPGAAAGGPARAEGVVAALRRGEDLGRVDADTAEQGAQRDGAVEEEMARLLEPAPALDEV